MSKQEISVSQWFNFMLFLACLVVSIHNRFVAPAEQWFTDIPYCEGVVAFFVAAVFGRLVVWAVKAIP